MNKYLELKTRQEAEFAAFPIFFAFSDPQFKEGMKGLGLQPEDTDKIFSAGGAGYYRKTDSQTLKDLLKRHHEETKAAIAADATGEGYISDMFDYELANHEHVITWDAEAALDALGLTREEVGANPAMLAAFEKAVAKQTENL